ncbi:MAG: histidine kinase, partial [Burkholderiaceae bacterium]|nr:histidine kinase [Burkholderiaceae bacterium]
MVLASVPAWAADADADMVCAPQVLSVNAAQSDDGVRPTQGWVPVTLPDVWTRRWPDYGGSVWYRMQWERAPECLANRAGASPLALGLNGMSMAGEVFINNDVLWRDASLVEPLSRSWNMPRAFVLPESALHDGVNTVWLRVVGPAQLSPGLNVVRLGPLHEVMRQQTRDYWRQRTVYLINLGLSAAVGGLFLLVWCMRRAEHAFGWHAAMSLCWMAYLTTLLVTSPWPFSSTLAMSRANVVVFVLYAACFCMFTFRFGQQQLVRTERLLWSLAGFGVVTVVAVPDAWAGHVLGGVWLVFVFVCFANCFQFQVRAWRTRDPQHILLALCWLFLLVVGIHDVIDVLALWKAQDSWASVTGPVATVFMAVLLGGRLVSNTRRIERFNDELGEAVSDARTELAQVLARAHEQALQH